MCTALEAKAARLWMQAQKAIGGSRFSYVLIGNGAEMLDLDQFVD